MSINISLDLVSNNFHKLYVILKYNAEVHLICFNGNVFYISLLYCYVIIAEKQYADKKYFSMIQMKLIELLKKYNLFNVGIFLIEIVFCRH